MTLDTDSGRVPRRDGSFAHRVRTAVSIVVLVAMLLALAWRGRTVLLLTFAGILFAVLLCGLAGALRRRTRWRHGVALAVVVVLLLALVAGVFWLAAPSISQQTDELAQSLPGSFDDLQEWLSQRQWGRWLLARAPEMGERLMADAASPAGDEAGGAQGGGAQEGGAQEDGGQAAGSQRAGAQAGGEPEADVPDDLLSRVTGIASSALAVLSGFFIVLFLGLYLAIEPNLYTGGLLRLVPKPQRERAREVLAILYDTLKWWLVARFTSMAVIGVLTWIGLAALGIPLAFVLAVLAAVLTFIPYVGPVLSALPPALLALAESPMKAVWVLVLFLGIQIVESYLVTPLIERKAVRLPPALTISLQVLITLLAGTLGLLLASPLVAVVMVLVQTLYVEDTLGDRLEKVGAGH